MRCGIDAYTLRRSAGLPSGLWLSFSQICSAICSASASDPALVTRLQMTDRMHSRSARTRRLDSRTSRRLLGTNRGEQREGEGAFVRDARGVEEQVGGGEHEGGHVGPAAGEDVLLRLETEAANLRLDDLGPRVGPGELRGEAHHRQCRLLLRRVHDRRHLVVAGAAATAGEGSEEEMDWGLREWRR
jgi:hypothetical protein